MGAYTQEEVDIETAKRWNDLHKRFLEQNPTQEYKPEKITIAKPGYEELYSVLVEALEQAQSGKGAVCHANGLPFMQQPIMQGARECGAGGLAFQARKKILEALNCKDDERAITDLLGAINYVAAMVLLRREGR